MKKVWVMMLATLMASSTMMAGNVKKSTFGCNPGYGFAKGGASC